MLVATRRGRSLGELAPSMPREVVELADKATQRFPEDRLDSAAAMLAAVREARQTLGVEAIQLFAAAWSEPRPADGARTLSAQMQTLPQPALLSSRTPQSAPEESAHVVAEPLPSPRPVLMRSALFAGLALAAALVFSSAAPPKVGRGLVNSVRARTPAVAPSAPPTSSGRTPSPLLSVTATPSLSAPPSTSASAPAPKRLLLKRPPRP